MVMEKRAARRVGVWLCGCLLLAAGAAAAKPWKAAVPGETSRSRIIDKFGAPTREISKGGKLSDGLRYEDEQAIEGALQADFYFDKDRKLWRIDVIPARELSREQVIRVYGKDYREGTIDSGLRYLQYKASGLTVFFEKEADRAKVFLFTAADTGPGR